MRHDENGVRYRHQQFEKSGGHEPQTEKHHNEPEEPVHSSFFRCIPAIRLRVAKSSPSVGRARRFAGQLRGLDEVGGG